MIAAGYFDGALWPGYEAVATRDSAAACFEILRFYRGLPMARLPALVAEFWRSPAGERAWRLDVLATVRYVAARGAAVFVVSATPTPVFGELAATLGIAGIVGLELEVDADNRATGRHTGIPTLGEGKVTRLRASTVAPCLLAAGNSALDVPLLAASRGLAWAVGPDATLAAAAQRHGWLQTSDPAPSRPSIGPQPRARAPHGPASRAAMGSDAGASRPASAPSHPTTSRFPAARDNSRALRPMTQPVPTFPRHARVVIIGGGIAGCSVAYHLGKAGWRDIVILERGQLTGGSTFHAAGLVGQLRSSANITKLLTYSVELYGILERETEQATGWSARGGLRLACTDERWTELKRLATTAHSFGLPMHLLSPAEAHAMWPLMRVDDLVGAAFLPTDGQVNPSDVAQAMVKGARMHGARCIEGCVVEAIAVIDGRVRSVRTNHGEIACEVVVNCAGLWASEIGRLAGVSVPVQAVQHQYLITEPIEGVTSGLPTLRDPDNIVYFKEEVGGLVMGGYEHDPLPWALGGVPADWVFKLIPPDWEHFESLAVGGYHRVPVLEDAPVRQLVNGPEAFTPDGSFILGEAPEVAGFFVAAGFNAYGIAAAGGAGRALADWIVGGEPAVDLWPVDIRRFGGHHKDATWTRTRTMEAYAHHYAMAWPHEEFTSGRPCLRSPLYDRLVAAGACFGEKMGWERPNWFAPPGVEAKDVYSYGYQNWFGHVGEEHRAVREAVGLFDETSFAKFEVAGAGAEAALGWMCAGDVTRPPGSLVYTQMLNDRGGIECDVTVARLAADRFYVVTGTGFRTHDLAWITRGLQTAQDASVADVTTARAVIGIMGPRARTLLQGLTDARLDDAAFHFLTAQEITLAGCRLLALRLTFVGELGWELHVPVASAGKVYDALCAAGAPLGLRHAGYRAIESLRLEKGYRVWSRDMTPDDTPLEAGLSWATKLASDQPFRGRDALLRQKAKGVAKRLAGFTVDDPHVVLLGRETIRRDGERVGWLSSGGFGYTVGKPIGYGYVRHRDGVDRAFLETGSYELEVAGDRVPCKLHLRPLYDPDNVRVRGQA